MARKAAAKVKRSRAKSIKRKHVTPRISTPAVAAPVVPKRPSLADDPRFAQAVQNYEAGLKALQARKFDRAKALLERVAMGPIKELSDRASVHLQTCEQQLARTPTTSFKSTEEHFDYAISLMNAGDYDSARGHLEKLQKQAAKADYVWYGLAVLDCLTQKFESALKHLTEAIRLDAANRYRARNEPDFQNISDDPRFTELLYPEAEAAVPAVAPAPEPRRRR
jgi:tetratricopeptide (TPR) repeat protein